MCGICGVINLKHRRPPETALIRNMIGRLTHRGPDSSGYFRDHYAALGHTRLSIIDLAGGAQPMSNEDGRLWISFNGELFNYVELARELASLGHVFKTKSDTEVILHAYEQWGIDSFVRMNGQWALALWDTARRELLLSRDRMGIRPLYYGFDDGRLLFASEVKAIFANPSIMRRPDPRGLQQIFTFWGPVAPRTAFAGIGQLLPGHFARIAHGSTASELKQLPYWQPDFAENPDESLTEADYAERLRHHLLRAARLRFTRTDVPVGAYLSGGLDSSITAALINRYTDVPLKTFSIRFEDSEFDETSFQQVMARRLGTEHHGVVVKRDDIGKVMPKVIQHVERPILRTAPAPMYLLSRIVREAGYKVVVTGEGADEVFAGYDIFREGKAREFVARGQKSELRAGIVTQLYPWMQRSPAQVPAFAKAFFTRNLDAADPAISHRPRWDGTSTLLGMINPEYAFEPNNEPPVAESLLATMPAESATWDSLGRAQWLEMKTLLEGYILSAQGDRMLMANSVEGRFPFLDPELVDFAGSLPARYKLMGLDEKHLLKAAFAELIPDGIVRRPKQPYRAPDASSLLNADLPWFNELMSESSLKDAGLFRAESVIKLIEKAAKRNPENLSHTDNMRIVGVATGMLWHHQMIRGDASGADEWPRTSGERPMTIVDRVERQRHEVPRA